MRKLLLFMVTIVTLMFTSCKQCSTKSKPLFGSSGKLVVEQTISTDRQAMFLKTNKDNENYRWYETNVKLKNFLDEENDGEIDMIVNIFQAIEEISETCFDTYVVKFQHFSNGDTETEDIHAFWVEDYPLNNESIKVTFEQAYEKVMSVNLPKPHSRYVVLRKQVGAVDANPQWIFGNLNSQIYVDAITGEVSNDNPAFRNMGFKMPLGEWP